MENLAGLETISSHQSRWRGNRLSHQSQRRISATNYSYKSVESVTSVKSINANTNPSVQWQHEGPDGGAVFDWCDASGLNQGGCWRESPLHSGWHFVNEAFMRVWMWFCKLNAANSNHTLTFKLVFGKGHIIILHIYKHFDRWERMALKSKFKNLLFLPPEHQLN